MSKPELKVYYSTDDHEFLFGNDDPEGVDIEASIEKLIEQQFGALQKAFGDDYNIVLLDENNRKTVYIDGDDIDGEEVLPWVESVLTDTWAEMDWIIEA